MSFISWLRGDDYTQEIMHPERAADAKKARGKGKKGGGKRQKQVETVVKRTTMGDRVTVRGKRIEIAYNDEGCRRSSRSLGLFGFLVGGTKQNIRDCEDAAGAEIVDD